jgi:hypothetical protein
MTPSCIMMEELRALMFQFLFPSCFPFVVVSYYEMRAIYFPRPPPYCIPSLSRYCRCSTNKTVAILEKLLQEQFTRYCCFLMPLRVFVLFTMVLKYITKPHAPHRTNRLSSHAHYNIPRTRNHNFVPLRQLLFQSWVFFSAAVVDMYSE